MRMPASLAPQQPVVGAQVEDDAAVQRHALAVVAGAAAAHRDGHAGRGAGGHDGTDLVLGLRARHGVGAQVLELALEHGAEPVEVLAQALDAAVGDPLQRRQARDDGGGGGRHSGGVELGGGGGVQVAITARS
jgi:hypothetical protein